MFKAQIIGNFTDGEVGGGEFLFGFFDEVIVDVLLGALPRQNFQ